MRIIPSKQSIFYFVLLFAGNAFAELTITPRLEIGQQDYSIDFVGTIPTPGGLVRTSTNFNVDPLLFRHGITFSYEKYFVDLYYQTTNEDTVLQLFPEFSVAESWIAETNEYNLTIGRSVFNSGFAFFGYRDHSQTAKGLQNSSYEFVHDGLFVGGGYSWIVS